MAAWMPQNIQKRLLRYVLQQLSLFAEIDLPNLDVSLGTNSKVHLKKLQLDPDKVDIPNFYLRNGVVDDMHLNLTLSNGVNIEATGVNLTLAPSMTNGVDFDPGKLSFSLYQSTADLATSVFFVDQDNNELPKTDKELDDEHDSSKNVANDDDSSPLADKENPKQPSKMGNMMAKAVEMALSRLQVQLKDINLTIITDESTFQICIEEASFDTTDGVRKIEFKGAELSVVKPSVYPGDQPQSESQDDSEDDDSVDESSSFDSHPTDFMSSSFIGSREELENSMLNSQSSVYMSATSKLLTKSKHSTRHPSETKPSVTLGHVNEGTLTFEGLQSFENVSIIIDQIHVAVSPIPESLTALLETLSKRLKILRVHSAKSKTSNTTTYTFSSKDGLQEEPEFSDQISTSSSTGFKELKINEIVISLNSALGKNGAFAIDNSLCLSIESLELAMVSEGNLSGTLKTLKMNKSETSEVFSFQPGSNYDVRFEMILDDDNDLYNITILCPKPGVFNLDEEVLNHLLAFCSKIPSTLHSLQSYQYQRAKLASLSNPQSNSNNDQENEIYLQTASFEFILKLTSSDKVKLTSFPLSFNSNTGVIEVERIVVERQFKGNQLKGDPPSQDRFKMQPHKSTNSGCLTCRKRQVKCDERKPLCLNCEKSEHKCTGFTHLSKDLPSSSSSLSSDDSYKSILLSNGLKTYLFKKPKKVKTFDKSGIQCSYLSPNASEIELIELEMTMSDFTSLIDSLELFFEQLKVVNHPKMDIAKEKTVFRTSFNSRNPVRNPRTLSSQTGAMFSHSSLVSFLRINSVSFLLKEVLNGFGDVSGRIKSINCNFHVKGFQDFFIGSLDVARIHKLSSQLILEKVDAPGNKKPMLIARLKSSSLTIQLADCLLHYYGEWYSFLHQCNMKEREIVKRQEDIGPKDRARDSNNFVISFYLNNIIIELNPVSLKSKAVLFIKKGCGTVTFGPQRLSISSSLTEITPLLIDDTKNLKNEIKLDSKNSHPLGNSFLLLLMDMGYISMGMFSSVSVSFETESSASLIAPVNVNVMCDTVRLDICADSLQCLLNLIKDLRQPIIVPFEQKYRTQPENPLDALKDVDFDAFLPQKTKDSNNVAATKARTFSETALNGAFRPKVYSDGSLEIIDNYYEHESVNQGLDNRTYGDLEVFEENSEDDVSLENSLNIKHDHFFHTSFMDNTRNTEHVPFKLNLSVEAVYIRLFDGYDWKETRVSILNAVRRVEAKAAAELSRIEKIKNSKLRRDSSASNSGNEGALQTDDDSATSGSVSEPVIEETLYQSIHLSLPVGMEPTLLAERVNNDVNFKRASSDSLDKTQSLSSVSSKSQVSSPQTRRLKLKRSTFHKVALELRNLSITFKLLSSFDPTTIKDKSSIRNPNSAEIVNRISVEVDDFLITDNIPTSTWKTFVTYLKEAGSRELNSKMVHLDIATIRPTRLLATTEMRIETNLLPLRLYVDQDTLDFLTRFGEFKDLRFVPQVVDDDDLFVSKLHVFPVRLKLDYKPKTVDYAGIRSGKTSEFMNFFILDEASMVLRDVVLYGVKITKLNPILNGIWTPDITRNQLKGVLSGLASINSVVKISSGFKDLIAIPMEEYRRDGRLITGVRKGAFSFAKTTGNELLKLGVKLVAGTQTILENTEQVLGGEGNLARMPVQVKERKQRRDSDEGNFYVITDRQTYERNLKKTSMNESIIGKTSLREANRFDEEYDDDDDDDEDDLVNKIKPHLRNTMLDSQLFLDDNEIQDEYEEQETDESQKTISLYANQPTTMKEGLQLAYQSFGRNIDSAKRAISKASSKVSEDNRTSNIAYEVMKATPVVVLRPIIGTTEAVSKALLGGLNQFDPDNRSKSEDKYKQ